MVMAVAFGGLLWLYLSKVFLIRKLGAEISALEARKEALQERIEELQYVLDHRAELQQLAIRTRLRYGLPGELVVLFETVR